MRWQHLWRALATFAAVVMLAVALAAAGFHAGSGRDAQQFARAAVDDPRAHTPAGPAASA